MAVTAPQCLVVVAVVVARVGAFAHGCASACASASLRHDCIAVVRVQQSTTEAQPRWWGARVCSPSLGAWDANLGQPMGPTSRVSGADLCSSRVASVKNARAVSPMPFTG